VVNKVQIRSKIHDFWVEFQSIITAFGKKRTLQLGILRQKQIDSISKTIALLLAGNTRWGTQVSINNIIEVICIANNYSFIQSS